MFKYTLDNKRYHTMNYYLKNRFHNKVFKVPLNTNFTCPNKQTGGCIYCSNYSKSNITPDTTDILTQFNEAKEIMEQKWPNSLYIPYFQAGTNTYGPIEQLKKHIDQLLQIPKVVGIAIATRPDCINDEWLAYLKELNSKTFLSIELGLQSANNNTLNFINRGHTKEQFADCVNNLKLNNIFTVAHIINGLPNETKEDMLNTASFLNELQIDAIKIHMLYISKDTPLAKTYQQNPFPILTKEQYVDIICDQLTILDEKIVIERITGDPIKEELIAPTWLLKKFCVLNDIDKEMVKRNIYQGMNCK